MQIADFDGIRANILLCDDARVNQNKLDIRGGGWNLMNFPPPERIAVAIRIEVPWALADQEIQFRVILVDADGRPIGTPGNTHGPILGGWPLTHPRSDDLPAGTPFQSLGVIELEGVPFEAGTRYSLRLEANEQEIGSAEFSVAAAS
jgi:hypothetical protein